MQQERDEEIRQTLDYEHLRPKSPSDFPWNRIFRRFGYLLVFLLIVYSVNTIQGGTASCLLVAVGIAAVGYWQIRKMIRASSGRHLTEEEFDAQSSRLRARKHGMAAEAMRNYGSVPLGIWASRQTARFQTDTTFGLGATMVDEQCMVRFNADGTGAFRWTRRGDVPLTVETQFVFERSEEPVADREAAISVQLVSPALDGWHEVRFGFDVAGQDATNLFLVIWFGSQNPLPDGLKDYWPFEGQYSREVHAVT